jgi:hypothetical protein
VTNSPPGWASDFSTAIAWLGLAVAGVVLATSWLIEYPDAILGLAWVVALLALVAVVVTGWRHSRSSGDSIVVALGKSLRSAGRFVFNFF